MARLRDPNKQIPGGLRYRQPETGYDSTQQLYSMPSLQVLAQAVLQHRRANSYLANVHGWSLDLPTIERQIEEYNAKICVDNGWLDYVQLGGSESGPSFHQPRQPGLASVVASGARGIRDLLGPDGAVPRDEANRRALICADCPKNSKGDWTRFFTVPASELIRGMTNAARDMALSTDFDPRLQICEVCKCPLKLKVHAKLEHIRAHMDNETLAALPQSYCWIVQPK